MLAPGLPRDMPLPPLGLHIVYLSVPFLVGATQAPIRRVNINSTYKPAHIHLWDLGGDWGVYWGTCKAGPGKH